MSTKYLLRFDDVSLGMAWSKFRPLKKELEQLGVKSILGVVPSCDDSNLDVEPVNADFFDDVRGWKAYGDTIAQHGTFHKYVTSDAGILGVNCRSEFAGLSFQTQHDKLKIGKGILEHEGVWEPVFMAPAHSFDVTTLQALSSLGFNSLTDGYGWHPYVLQGLTLVPQLTASPINIGIGVCTICVHINTMTEKDCKALLLFVKKNTRHFISFSDALMKCKPVPVFSPLLRWVSKRALKIKRGFS